MHADALLEERRVLGRLIVEERVGSRVDCCRRREKAARESESESVHGCGIGSLTPNTGYALVAYIELLGADGVPRIAQGLAVSAAGLLSCLPILSKVHMRAGQRHGWHDLGDHVGA